VDALDDVLTGVTVLQQDRPHPESFSRPRSQQVPQRDVQMVSGDPPWSEFPVPDRGTLCGDFRVAVPVSLLVARCRKWRL
jgi:hypothetical protein